jgi:hypothetical protein
MIGQSPCRASTLLALQIYETHYTGGISFNWPQWLNLRDGVTDTEPASPIVMQMKNGVRTVGSEVGRYEDGERMYLVIQVRLGLRVIQMANLVRAAIGLARLVVRVLNLSELGRKALLKPHLEV